MRSKEERRVRHTTAPKVQRSNAISNVSGVEEIIQENGKMYKRIKVDNQQVYIPLKTEKE